MGNKKSQLKIGALINYFAIGFNIIAGIVYTPWMIEQIGRNDYGLYTLANSLIAMFLVDFGLSSATSRYIAKYRAENKTEELNKFLNIIYRLYLIIDAIILLSLVVIFFCLNAIYYNLSAEELDKLKVVYCIAGMYSLISFPCITFNGVLNAYEKFLPLKIADLIQKVFFILFTFIALYMGYGLYALVTVNALGGLLAIAIKFYYVQKTVRIKNVKIESGERKSFFKEIFTFSLWSTVCTLAYRLIFNISPTLIGLVIADAAAAISVFGIVTTIEGYFHVITTAIDGMFISRVTRLMKGKEWKKELNLFSVKLGRFQFGLNGLLVVVFFVVGKQFVSLWVGNDFIEAYYGIVLIIIPSMFYNALHIFHTVISVENIVKYQAYIQIIIGVCNVVLSLIFCYFFGVIGACMSICAAYVLRTVLMILLAKNKLNFDVKYFLKKCYLKMSVPVVISLVVGYVLTDLIDYKAFVSVIPLDLLSKGEIASWISWALSAAVVSIVYLVSLVLFGLESVERKSILGNLKRHN